MMRIRLSRLLGDARMTQIDLARKTGIRPSTINEMYHELCERVNLEHIDLICEVLGCSLTDLLEYIPNTEPYKKVSFAAKK
jgi:putative transcriptional regulator